MPVVCHLTKVVEINEAVTSDVACGPSGRSQLPVVAKLTEIAKVNVSVQVEITPMIRLGKAIFECRVRQPLIDIIHVDNVVPV